MNRLRCTSLMTVGWCLHCPIDDIFVNLVRALRPEDAHVYWGSKLLGDWTSYLERFATRTPLYKLICRVFRKETEDIFDVHLVFTVQCAAHLRSLVNLRYINGHIDWLIYDNKTIGYLSDRIIKMISRQTSMPFQPPCILKSQPLSSRSNHSLNDLLHNQLGLNNNRLINRFNNQLSPLETGLTTACTTGLIAWRGISSIILPILILTIDTPQGGAVTYYIKRKIDSLWARANWLGFCNNFSFNMTYESEVINEFYLSILYYITYRKSYILRHLFEIV